MGKYLATRVALVIPTALAASLLIFVIMRVLPGDVALTILSDTPHSVEMREALRDELGLNDPLALQYGRWLWRMVNGEFGGQSLQMREPIGAILARQLPVTVLVAFYTMVLSILISVPLGVAAALRPRRWIDISIRLLTLGGLALPNVWLALVLILVLLRVFRWSPPIIYSGLTVNPADHFALVVWPVLLLTWQYSSHLVRAVRSAMIDSLTSVHSVAERARGIRERTIVWAHAGREALVPTITVLGLQFGTLLGGTIVLEMVFGLPGVGRGLVQAAIARDYPVVQSVAFLMVTLYLVVNVVVDATYRLADPRIRLASRRHR